MTQGNSGERNSEQEPITFVDNRKVDPETGEIREPAAADAAAAGPDAGNGADAVLAADEGQRFWPKASAASWPSALPTCSG